MVAAVLDTKPYVQHHPVFGYQYRPGTTMLLEKPGGGHYKIRVNAQGIRSDREYSATQPSGTYRIVVLGDSMAAGQFVANESRFSEILERRVSGLEVVNLGLEGSGTDQQVLLYEHLGLTLEHDAVLILPYLQNVRRNMVEARDAIDPRTGLPTLRPKPRFELIDGELVLRNVPVPVEINREQWPSGASETRNPRLQKWKTRIAALPGAGLWRKAIQSVIPWEPFPEYRDENSREWRLMTALMRRLRSLAGERPVVVAPIFYSNYVRFRMARNYWKRFSSLRAIPGVFPVDLLPHFVSGQADEALACFQDPYDMHLSAFGHLVLAEALQAELTRLNLRVTAPL